MNQQLAKSVYFRSKNIENIFQELINKTEQEIIDIFKEYEINCTCNKCQSACQRRVCWGLPSEIKKLIDLGYSDRLMIDYYESIDPKFNLEFVYVLTPVGVYIRLSKRPVKTLMMV